LPGSSVIYAVNHDPPSLIPVDLAHHATGRPVPLPAGSPGAAVTADRATGYVMVGASLVQIDLTTGAPGGALALPAGPWVRSGAAYARIPPDSFQIAPDGRTAYVLHGNALIPVDLRTAEAGQAVTLPKLSIGSVIIAAGGRTALLTGFTITASGLGEQPAIVPVDLAAGTAGQPIVVPGLGRAAVAPDGRMAYSAAGNALLPIDLATGRIGWPVRLAMMVGIGAIAVTPDGRTAYAGNLKPGRPSSGVVVPIDLATLTAGPPIRVPSYPYSISSILITPDGRTAAVGAYSAVIPIDLRASKAGEPIQVPDGSAVVLLR
jgi:hypothetical protein